MLILVFKPNVLMSTPYLFSSLENWLYVSSIVPPKVVLPAPVVRAIKGYVLRCSATGSPLVYVALIKNATVLVNTTNTAQIELNQQGNYTCVAISKYGTDVKEFPVTFNSESYIMYLFVCACFTYVIGVIWHFLQITFHTAVKPIGSLGSDDGDDNDNATKQ